MDDDREIALAYQIEKAMECSGCGTRRDEWPDSPLDPAPYVAEATRCPGCERLEIEVESQRGDDRPKGLKYRLVRPEDIAPPTLTPNQDPDTNSDPDDP